MSNSFQYHTHINITPGSPPPDPRPPGLYLGGVVRLLLVLGAWFAGAGLLAQQLQPGLQLLLLVVGAGQPAGLLAVHRLQLAAELPLLGAQLPQPGRLAAAHRLQLLEGHQRGDGGRGGNKQG